MQAGQSLADHWSSQFSSVVRDRGHQYYLDDRVEIIESSEESLTAAVRGGSGDYTVVVNVDDVERGVFSVLCDCPHFVDGNFCKP